MVACNLKQLCPPQQKPWHESRKEMDFNEEPDAALFLEASLHLIKKTSAFTWFLPKQIHYWACIRVNQSLESVLRRNGPPMNQRGCNQNKSGAALMHLVLFSKCIISCLAQKRLVPPVYSLSKTRWKVRKRIQRNNFFCWAGFRFGLILPRSRTFCARETKYKNSTFFSCSGKWIHKTKLASAALIKGGRGHQGIMDLSGEKEKPFAWLWQSSDALCLIH